MDEFRILILSTFFLLFRSCHALAPIFSGLPTSIGVGELETTSRLIYTITVSDPENDPIQCDVASTSPANGPFLIILATDTGRYGVYTNSPTFDFATTTIHTVNIDCWDTGGLTSTGVLSVDIIDDDALTLLNLPHTVTVDASSVLNGVSIFTVSLTDALGHTTFFFTMTSSPSTTSFDIDAGTGEVTTARDLIYEIESSVKLYITVSDGSISVVEVLTVSLTNVNNVPVFTNLPASIDVSESTASGTVLITLTPSDADPGASLTFSFAVDPAAATSLFSYNTNTQRFSLATGMTFNYENAIYYNVTFTIFDTMATGGPFVLDVNIKNADEPCYFDKTMYTLSTSEGSAGSISLDPNFIVQDYDGISSYILTFTTANNSERFTIDDTTGVIGFAVDYDVDNSAMPANVILTVQCEDPSGQTGTTNVEINIADVNDNAPTFAQASYTLNVNQETTPGSLIGALAPTDADSGTNADYSCSATTSSAIATTYYNIGADCGVYLTTSPAGVLTYGTTVQFTVTATDNGATPLSGTTFVDIIFIELVTTTTTTTTTTTPATNFFDDPGSLAAFCLAVIFGAVVLGLFIYLLSRYCYTGAFCGPEPFDFCRLGERTNDCCRRQRPPTPKKRTVTPETPEKPPSKSKDEFEYWREDSDYGSMNNDDSKLNRSSRFTRHREYPDFPRTANAVTPTDVRLSYGRPGTRVLPLGYY